MPQDNNSRRVEVDNRKGGHRDKAADRDNRVLALRVDGQEIYPESLVLFPCLPYLHALAEEDRDSAGREAEAGSNDDRSSDCRRREAWKAEPWQQLGIFRFDCDLLDLLDRVCCYQTYEL